MSIYADASTLVFTFAIFTTCENLTKVCLTKETGSIDKLKWMNSL